IGNHVYARTEPETPPPTEAAYVPDQATMGLRDFAEINATLAQLTGISPTNGQVASTYAAVKQQLPTLTNLDTFLAAQQMGITQLTVAYCSSLVDSASARGLAFPGFDFTAPIGTAFNTDLKRSRIIEPLLQRLLADR